MLVISTVRVAEGWTVTSVAAGLVLLAGLVALVVWGVLRASRDDG